MAKKSICIIDGCDKPIYNKKMCSSHFSRWRDYGDPASGGTPRGELMRYIKEVALKFNSDDCLTWPYARDKGGYARIRVRGTSTTAHRVVCELAHGQPLAPKAQAAHLCGKGHEGCVNPRHLSWKTCKENIADKVAHGTHRVGTNVGSAKINESIVSRIRRDGATHIPRQLAEKYGLGLTTIRQILSRKTWRHVE